MGNIHDFVSLAQLVRAFTSVKGSRFESDKKLHSGFVFPDYATYQNAALSKRT